MLRKINSIMTVGVAATIKRVSLSLLILLFFTSVHGQWSTFSPANIGAPTGRDLVFDKPGHLAENFNRLGHLESGTYGTPTGKWSAIGVPNLNFPPSNNNYYGFMANWETDRAFFGIRRDGSNNANAIIAFGDNYVGDPSDGVTTGNRLIFQFDSWVPTMNREVATMMANGNFGLGTSTPTAQLHTTGTVRFQGLPLGIGVNMLVVDALGNVRRQNIPGSGFTNNCNSLNFVPRVGAGSTFICSQIQDIGTGVGINMVPGSYVAGSSVFTSGNPSNGFVRLDVNGLTRSASLVITSDSRLKENVVSITNPLGSLLKLNGVQYQWTREFAMETRMFRGPQLGFIAQDVAKVFPEAVTTDERGYRGLNYNFFIPVIVESIKEQQKVINQNTEDIEVLKDQLKRQQDELNSLTRTRK